MSQQQIFDAALPRLEQIADGAVLLRSYAEPSQAQVLEAIHNVEALSPFRHMVTPGGFRMSVAMTNAGRVGWVSDRSGYRYSPLDPLSGQSWPPLPDLLSRLAADAAASAGFPSFEPDVCLINRYEPGARMALHQDKDERDFDQPIVSLSLGLPATFMFGGLKRTDKPVRIRLLSGDIVVWGGVNRLAYHGIAPLAKGVHPLTGAFRMNLTFRHGL
jgi:alkylated DNA repair protein (DNA oxidative demethylase)